MAIIWNKVTWYSKLLAVIVFVGAVWLGFYFNSEFKKVAGIKHVQSVVQKMERVDTSDWKTYEDEDMGYSVAYPESYHVAYKHNLVNYNENSPEYVKGNPNGVKIQFYRGNAFGLDLTKSYQREELFKSYYGSDASIARLPTKVEGIAPVGEFTYRNSILSGPGGAFDVYYAFAKDGKSYYTATVWYINNDAKTVMNILSSFRPIAIPNYKVFRSDTNKFEIHYPKDFTFSESNDAGYNNELNLYHVSFNPSPNYQKGTDFGNAFVDVSISSKTENCKKQNPQGLVFTGTKTIGGETFYFDPKQPTSDAAMGGERGFSSLFATVYNGQCYRIQKLLSYRDLHGFVDEPYNYPPHFDEKKVNEDLDTIINSFKFTK